MGNFPIIVPNSVVVVKFLCVNTLSIFSPSTAALHFADLILNFIILHCGKLEAFGLSFSFTKKHWQTESKASTKSCRSKQEQNTKQTHQKLHQ